MYSSGLLQMRFEFERRLTRLSENLIFCVNIVKIDLHFEKKTVLYYLI